MMFSWLLAIVWAWIPLSLFFGGIGSLIGGIGLLILLAWLYVMRGAIAFERHRAQAIYGDNIPVPVIPKSRRTGFGAWLENQWFHLRSGSFWLGSAHHFASLLYGFFVVSLALFLAGSAAFALGISLMPASSPLFDDFGPGPELVNAAPWLSWGWGIGGILLALVLLWIAPYGDRGINRIILRPSRHAELTSEVKQLSKARIGAVDAAESERRRIERNLHDGAQPRLVALSMSLGMARAKFDSDPEKARALLDEAHIESKAAINDLRQLARGIHPAVLEDRGLDAALSALAARSMTPVALHTELDSRADSEAESVAYFFVAEALTNANKHAQATRISVSVVRRDAALEVVVIDDGVGGARVVREGESTGLAGLADRVTSARGTLNLTSPNGGPTTLVVTLPCAS